MAHTLRPGSGDPDAHVARLVPFRRGRGGSTTAAERTAEMARLSFGGGIWRDERRVLRAGLATALVCSLVTTVVASIGVPRAVAAAATTTYSATETIPVPPASNYAGSGGGDGWAVALSTGDVYNVFHHQATPRSPATSRALRPHVRLQRRSPMRMATGSPPLGSRGCGWTGRPATSTSSLPAPRIRPAEWSVSTPRRRPPTLTRSAASPL